MTNLQRLVRITQGITLALLLLAAIVISLTTSARVISAAPTDSAVVRAGTVSIPPGESIIALPVEVLNVQNLGAATVVVSYDPAVLAVNDCRRGSAFDYGICNTEYDQDGGGVSDAVLFNVNALSGVTATAEIPVTLVDLVWELGESEPGVTSTLELEVRTFTDVEGVPISVSPQNGQIAVIAEQVRVDDIMVVAANLGQPAAGALQAYDPVSDGTIDEQDLMAFAEAWRDWWP